MTEPVPVHGCMIDGQPAMPILISEYNALVARAASAETAAQRMTGIQGRCPACGWASLFLGDGGHVTCSRLECPNPSAADDLLHATPGPEATQATELEKTARVFAALHQSAEQTVSRVIALYEQWVKAGPPKPGTPLARWWDKRLVELRAAINTEKEI